MVFEFEPPMGSCGKAHVKAVIVSQFESAPRRGRPPKRSYCQYHHDLEREIYRLKVRCDTNKESLRQAMSAANLLTDRATKIGADSAIIKALLQRVDVLERQVLTLTNKLERIDERTDSSWRTESS